MSDYLLSEFIDAWNAGRRPRVREYLARVPAGPHRDALADQLMDWLAVAPTPDYDDAARAAIREEPVLARVLESAQSGAGLWPAVVPALRERAGLSVGQLAARVAERFRFTDTERAAGYLNRLESGALDPARVSKRLLDALGDILGVQGGSLADAAAYSGALRPAGGTKFRAAAPAAAELRDDIEALSRAALTPAPPPLDELDRLFTGGRDA